METENELIRIKSYEKRAYMRCMRAFICGSTICTVQGEYYCIHSYATLIAQVRISDRRLVRFNNKYYSATTSKLQKLVTEIFGTLSN